MGYPGKVHRTGLEDYPERQNVKNLQQQRPLV